MANQKMLVTFNHANKTATMAFVNDQNEILYDYKGQELNNMAFPYENLSSYNFLFEKIEDDGNIGRYYFPMFSKG